MGDTFHADAGDDDDDALAPGALLGGRYRIGKQLGKGGMGTVYSARHVDLGRDIALKVIARRHARDERVIARFRREARAAAQARHPNIVDVIDLGEADGRWYLAMELLDGIDLAQAIALKRVYEPAELPSVLDPVLAALDSAHAIGLVHRDLKPENIFLARTTGDDAHVKVLDFGVVKVIDEGAEKHLTRTGTVVGTPEYMAPEQAQGGVVDARADLYAIGCVAYNMLTGRPPFSDASILAVLAAHVCNEPVPPSQLRPALPASRKVDAFIEKALAKRADDRFQTAAEMRAALKELAQATSDASGARIRLTIPSQQAMAQPGLGSTRPDGSASAEELARTTPHGSQEAAARAPSDKATAPAAGSGGVSTRGIVLAAIVGAILAAIATYFLVAR
jgi:eukaryotic-like serine/threonine-protein kinase